MPVFRYRFLGVVAEQLARQVPGAFSVGSIYPNVFLDITAENLAKDDLDETLARLNYVYDSTDPELAPATQSKQADQADTAEGKVDTIDTRDAGGALLSSDVIVGGIKTSETVFTYDVNGDPVQETRTLFLADGSIDRIDTWSYSVVLNPDGTITTTKKAVP